MKKFAVVLMAVAFMFAMGSNVYAYDMQEHVKVAPNSEGDAIIFPFYLAMDGGWETKLTVTNTSPTYSVVAKVVFKTMMYSEEILDFLIYLTPNDVWTGYLRNSNGNTIIHSTDDSMLAPNGDFASATNPVNHPLPVPTCATVVGDTNQIGYAEVIETWFCDVSQPLPWVADPAPPAGVTWRKTPPVSKGYLKQLYNPGTFIQAPTTTNREQYNNQFNDQTINVLTGQMEFQNPSAGLVASMRATVLADFDTRAWLTAAVPTGIPGTDAYNLLGEVEAALSGNNYIMSYVNNADASAVTAHVFTFPTKQTQFVRDAGENFCAYVNGSANSPFWFDWNVNFPTTKVIKQYRCASYGGSVYDLSENTSTSNPYSGPGTQPYMCDEVNIKDSGSFPFNEGFARYNFTLFGHYMNPTRFNTFVNGDGNNVVLGDVREGSYSGIPALATIVYFKDGAIAMKEAARTDGTVVARDTITNPVTATTYPALADLPAYMPEYQYYNNQATLFPAPATVYDTTTIGPTFQVRP